MSKALESLFAVCEEFEASDVHVMTVLRQGHPLDPEFTFSGFTVDSQGGLVA